MNESTYKQYTFLKQPLSSDNNLSSVPSTLLASAVVCLETVAMDDTNLTASQVTAILQQILDSPDRTLRHVDMMGVDKDLIPPDILGQVMERRELKINM